MDIKCKVKVLTDLAGVFPELQPEIGKVYDAKLVPGKLKAPEVAVITVKGKYIICRHGEFEVVG